jgi:DNA-directed RNA polymerase subunit beta
MTPEEILATFHDTDTFTCREEGARSSSFPSVCAARLRASTWWTRPARSSSREGQAHHRQAHPRDRPGRREDMVDVPDDFLLGRVSRPMSSIPTGELLARANDEITEDLLDKLLLAGVTGLSTLYMNDLDRGGTSRRRCVSTRPPTSGRPRSQSTA